ncbi:MAG: HutP family protein, partial [Bacilli bacterium]
MADLNLSIGKSALHLALFPEEVDSVFIEQLRKLDYKFCTGKAGSMELSKIVAAVESTAKKCEIINPNVYREVHALYHAIME